MADILFLAHRIPYPPDKGDKIRSWHLLSHLARNHHVHLGCLIDDPADIAHVDRLKEICASVEAVPIRPQWQRFAALRGLVTGEALTLPYFHNARLQRWTARRLHESQLDAAFAFSSGMAPYLAAADPPVRRVIDFVDLDSRKWHDYADEGTGALGWLYRREGRKLAIAEQQFVERADLSLFVSAQEAAELLTQAPELAPRIAALENGVDIGYFDPATNYPMPDARFGEAPSLVFTGAMDYRANIEGIVWFVRQVWGRIRQAVPQALLFIVGARPSASVVALAGQPGVVVTGRVPDIRPWLAHADLTIAPLRIARGIQNKVLEAMAMGKAMLCTTAANTGIEAADGKAIALADGARPMAERALQLLANPAERTRFGQMSRHHIQNHFQWRDKLEAFEAMLLGQSKAMI